MDYTAALIIALLLAVIVYQRHRYIQFRKAPFSVSQPLTQVYDPCMDSFFDVCRESLRKGGHLALAVAFENRSRYLMQELPEGSRVRGLNIEQDVIGEYNLSIEVRLPNVGWVGVQKRIIL